MQWDCLTLLVGAASALALSIDVPSNATVGGSTSITWSSSSSDPVFSIELNNPSLNSALAIANNVNPADNNATVVIPTVPATDGYTLTFVNITDISDVFATSPSFSIAAATSASSSATGSASGSGVSLSESASATGSTSKVSVTSPSSSAPSISASNKPNAAAAASIHKAVLRLGALALTAVAFVL
ncbi:hypothetical protein DFH06DRAFT_1465087 [Mycena polygramma]|nr:hypothetical protein DFH06DRAFT_1465087 [Mycena polygramma]